MAKVRRKPGEMGNPVEAGAPQHFGNTATADDARERVAVRAYEIYMARGAQEGRALDDWLEAEREVLNRGNTDSPFKR